VGAQTSEVRTIRVNCQVNATRYSVFSRLFEGTFDYEPPSSGISFKKLFGQIAEKLVEEDKVLVVALDDINYLFYENEASDTLYSLLRAHEEYPGRRSVSSSSPLIPRWTSSTNSTPESRASSARRMSTSPSTTNPRSSTSSRSGSNGLQRRRHRPDTLEYVAELTAESGDLRVGIDLLRRAGLNAEMRASRTVERQDVENAYEKSKYINLSRSLSGLTDTERALLEVIADRDGDQAGEVYEVFHDRTDLGYTRYSEIVNKLDQLGLIDADYADVDGRGRSRSLTLSYEKEAVLDRLE